MLRHVSVDVNSRTQGAGVVVEGSGNVVDVGEGERRGDGRWAVRMNF